MAEDDRISRTLSLWLRHRPELAQITLTESGWARIADVIAALSRKGWAVSPDRLADIVAGNAKQRFELSPDAGLIRARQGHSIPIAGEWPKADPPDRLYHGTVARFLPAILKDGLKPMRRHHVHLSPDIATAERVGRRRGEPVILTVRAADLAAAGQDFLLAGNGVWLTAHVPPDFLSLLEARA